MEKIGFFEFKAGHKSSIRLQMFLTLLFTFLVVGYQTYIQENHTPDFLTMITLLTASFTPKLIQNLKESKEV
jgi:hypothetical protein